MAIEHMDFPSGYDGLWGLDASHMENGIYANADVGASVYMTEDPDANVDGPCLNIHNIAPGNGYTEHLRYVLNSTNDTVGIACRYYWGALPLGSGAGRSLPQFNHFNNISNTVMMYLQLESTGALTVKYRNDSSVQTYTTPAPCIVAGTWHHIEMKVVRSTTVGTIEVRVDGVPVIALTGLNNGASAIAQVAWGVQNGVGQLQHPSDTYMKDLVIWNGSGSQNNDFLGSVQVYPLIPTADDTFAWTPSTGTTGYNLIDEAPTNDTDYIMADDTYPAAAVFELSDLPEDVTSIRGVKTFVRSRKTDGGDAQLQTSMRSNAVDGDGFDRPITTIYTTWTDIFEVDPDTNTTWTRSGINNSKLVINRTL